MTRQTIRFVGLPVISALATILVAATFELKENWVRLRALPREERQRLVENLRKFDLVYTREQQQGLRDLDKRINELDPARQAQFLTTLRRYHNWLNQLPESKQDGLNQAPAGERMKLVKKLLVDYPVPKAATKEFLRLIDVGEDSPFELAAIYRIWQKLKPDERRRVEQIAVAQRRREELFRLGESQDLPREVKPEGYDDEKSVAQLEASKKSRPVLLLEKLEKKQEARRAEILRRQAINYHFLAKEHRPKTVTSDHLAEFLATFPPWLKASFDHYPPDEARRRLTVVYRLVFPPGSEIKAVARPVAPAAPTRTSPVFPRGAPSPGGKAVSDGGKSTF